MQYDVEVNGRVRRAVVQRVNGVFVVEVDGRVWRVDAARVSADVLSLLVEASGESGQLPDEDARAALRGRAASAEVVVGRTGTNGLVIAVGSHSFVVSLDGLRRRKRDDGGGAGSGPQRLVAPMPGKVVRVLVQVGEFVRTRQPLVVVEAMKMENELRAGRDGVIAEMHARAGESVEAGALLAVIAAPAE